MTRNAMTPFYGIGFCILGVTLIFYYISLKRKNKPLLDKFSQFADKSAKTVWRDIVINYTDEMGDRSRIRLNSKCNIYLFDNYLC